MRIEHVGDIRTVRTVLVVEVARDRSFLAFGAWIAVVVVTKTLVCM